MGTKSVKQQLQVAEFNPKLMFLLNKPLSFAKSLCNQVPSFVTKREFVVINSILGRKQAEGVAEVFLHKGFVSMYEFLSAMLLLASASWSEKLHGLFALFDVEKRGELDRETFEILSVNALTAIRKVTGVRVMTKENLSKLGDAVFANREGMSLEELGSLVKSSAIFSFMQRVQKSSAPVLHPALYAFEQSNISNVRLPRLDTSYAGTRSPVSRLDSKLRKAKSQHRKVGVVIKGQLIKPIHVKRLRVLYELLSFHAIDCIRMSELKTNKTYKFLKRITLGVKGALRKAPTFEKFLEEIFPFATVMQINVLTNLSEPNRDLSRISEHHSNKVYEEDRSERMAGELQY